MISPYADPGIDLASISNTVVDPGNDVISIEVRCQDAFREGVRWSLGGSAEPLKPETHSALQ